jgi:hypothetical protein
MYEGESKHSICRSIEMLPLEELRRKWSEIWGIEPHSRIGRMMLIKSLEYKTKEQESHFLNSDYHNKLNQLIKSYKRNQSSFDAKQSTIKTGTRLIRNWNGERYTVLVQNAGYEFKGKIYNSLSQIAYEITGTRWNGWLFFGLKKKRSKS